MREDWDQEIRLGRLVGYLGYENTFVVWGFSARRPCSRQVLCKQGFCGVSNDVDSMWVAVGVDGERLPSYLP